MLDDDGIHILQKLSSVECVSGRRERRPLLFYTPYFIFTRFSLLPTGLRNINRNTTFDTAYSAVNGIAETVAER